MTCPYYLSLCERKDTPSAIVETYCKEDKFYRCTIFEGIERRLEDFIKINGLEMRNK